MEISPDPSAICSEYRFAVSVETRTEAYRMKERVASNSVSNREKSAIGQFQIGAVRGSLPG